MLKITIPNKGVLAEPAAAFLQDAGYLVRSNPKDLYQPDPKNGVEFFYLRPRDIATYVGSGALHVGITGRDLLQESDSKAEEILDLGFAKSTFHFAATPGEFSSIDDLAGKRIGTSYPKLVEKHFEAKKIAVEVVKLDGAVENSIRLGVADAIADVVETGATIKAAGLEIFGESLLASSAVLVKSPSLADSDSERLLQILLHRLEGLLVARRFVLIDYDVPVNLLEKATALTPGLESPTVSPLQDPNWVAVRAMVTKSDSNEIMDQLYSLGAKAILVSTINSARI